MLGWEGEKYLCVCTDVIHELGWLDEWQEVLELAQLGFMQSKRLEDLSNKRLLGQFELAVLCC